MTYHHFVSCGNKIGLVPLTLAGYSDTNDSWRNDRHLRELLVSWGQEIGSDSIMVLTGDPRKRAEQGYHVAMTVFEPCGTDNENNLPGGLSNMCGNGVRAVAAFVREFDRSLTEILVKTGSGLRKITYEPQSDLYVVEMGELSYLNAPIPREIQKDLSVFISAKTWSIGLNGTRARDGSITGEPHVVIEVTQSEAPTQQSLRHLAVMAGPLITKNRNIFPQEINANFIMVRDNVIFNATHERNLGDDANHSVTAACGTGSTVAAGVVMEKYHKTQILVKNMGGDLIISPDPNLPRGLLMKGEAHRVEYS